jgi:hypothetical protein
MPDVTTELTTSYHNSAIEDMMGRPPGWLLRSGLSVVAISVVVALSLAALISYPERVEAPFVLQTKKVPLAVNAGAVNYVDTMLVGDEQKVSVGDTLLIFRSDGDWRTLRQLDRYLRKAATSTLSKLPAVPTHDYPVAIERVVGQLNAVIESYASYRSTNGTDSQLAALESEIEQAAALSSSLEEQVRLYDEELTYKDLNLKRARGMKADSLISSQEAESIEEQTLAAYRQREVLVASDAQNRLRINQAGQQILRLRLDHRERLAEFERLIRQQLRLLRAAADEYSLQYFIIAREAGTIDWMPEVREDALVGGGVPLGFLIPEWIRSVKVARLSLPTQGAGRVALGDEVVLELDAYPSREFGQIEGGLVAVDAVAIADEKQGFVRQATVALPDSLVTSYGMAVPFQYNLTGMARIITEERTLLQRLTDQVLNLSQNS